MAYPPLNETLRGQTSGVFVVLLIITTMPKGPGNLLAVLFGAASYLLFLMLQPSEESPVEEVCQKAASGCTARVPEDADGSGASGRGEERAEEEVPGSTEPPQLDESLQGELAKLKKARNSRRNRARFQDFLREFTPSGAEAVPAPADPEVHEEADAKAREKDTLVRQQAAAAGAAGSPDQQPAPSQGVHFMEARLAGDVGEAALAASPAMASPSNTAQAAQTYGFHLAGLGQPVCVPFVPLRVDPPAPRTKPPAPTPEQQNWEECWDWASRGWCPKGPACKWSHPRDKDTDSNFYHPMSLAADSGEVPAAACRDKDGASGGARVERASTVDPADAPKETLGWVFPAGAEHSFEVAPSAATLQSSESTLQAHSSQSRLRASADASDPDAFLTDDGF